MYTVNPNRQGEFQNPPPLVRQESAITRRLSDRVPLSDDNWCEIFRLLGLGDFLSVTAACLALENLGQTFFEQYETPLRFAPNFRMMGLASLGGGGRFGSVMFIDLGTVGELGSLEPVVAALRAAEEGSTNLRMVNVRVELKKVEDVTALNEVTAPCSVLKVQATLNLAGACQSLLPLPRRALHPSLLVPCFSAPPAIMRRARFGGNAETRRERRDEGVPTLLCWCRASVHAGRPACSRRARGSAATLRRGVSGATAVSC